MIHAVTLHRPDDLDEFRAAARRLLAAGIAPADVGWSHGSTGTLFVEPLPEREGIATVPRAFADLAAAVICHREETRWSLLYEALWRIDRGMRHFLDQPADPLVHRLRRMESAVRRDQHRMTAFLRFRLVRDPDGDVFIAWYQPRHHVLRRTASFFIDRFASMRFSILTPDLTLHWDRHGERFTPGLRRQDAPSEDAIEAWWRDYYAAIFNPARVNPRLMHSHMPKQFWRDLPETRSIPDLIKTARARTERMIR